VEKVAAFAAGLDVQIAAIWHSGKTRAAQTAEILGASLNPSGGVMEKEHLGPDDAVKPLKKALSKQKENAMVVGHLPFLNRLASELLGAKSEHAVTFPPAGMACVERQGDGTWSVCWAVEPSLLK
jgi:phosphohistidine phosphatase